MDVDRLTELALGDAKDFSRELGLLDAYVHRRVMAWFIRRREGVAGADVVHDFWLSVEDKLRAMRLADLARIKRIAETFVNERAALELEPDRTTSVHVEPPMSAA